MTRLELLRAGADGRAQAMRVDVRSMLRGRGSDLLLHDYDIVHVPRTAIAEVDLFVDQYINRVVPRLMGFNLIYNLNPDINVNSDSRSRR
jgi:hypothetical protein